MKLLTSNFIASNNPRGQARLIYDNISSGFWTACPAAGGIQALEVPDTDIVINHNNSGGLFEAFALR